MRLPACVLLLAACASSDASLTTPPGIVALRPARDLDRDPQQEIVVVVHADSRRDANAAQVLASRTIHRTPDLVVVAAGAGSYTYGVAHVDVTPGEVHVRHAKNGEQITVDIQRMRDLSGTMFVRLRRDSLHAEAYALNGTLLTMAD